MFHPSSIDKDFFVLFNIVDFGLVSLETKTKTQNGVEFTVKGHSPLDSGKVVGNMETKYKWTDYGETAMMYSFQSCFRCSVAWFVHFNAFGESLCTDMFCVLQGRGAANGFSGSIMPTLELVFQPYFLKIVVEVKAL